MPADQPPATSPSDQALQAMPYHSLDMEHRRHQIFPVLSAEEVQRLHRFGRINNWAAGERPYETGQPSPGMLVILQGRLSISRHDGLGHAIEIIEEGPGEFTGEVGQLSGRPSLVTATALTPLQAIVITPAELRSLLMAEAELGERIMRALILRRVGLIETGSGGPVLVASPGNASLLRLQGFLSSNGHPHQTLDPASDADAQALIALYMPSIHELPLVVLPDGSVKKNPSENELGHLLRMLPELDCKKIYDVLIVGAGPSGLATAVYAASEGLSVLVLESRAYGGQAGASARIENYLGFPTGISGRALAGRAYVQAQKFGAVVAVPTSAIQLGCDGLPFHISLDHGVVVRGRSVVIACGARYRRPDIPDLQRYEGNGVYYWASPLEGKLCSQQKVILVGGGNSAGQAAVYLSQHAQHVHMVIRGPSLAASMSSYLIERIAATANITLHTRTEIVQLDGDDAGLQAVHLHDLQEDSTTRHDICRVFLFVGADPNTGWLSDCGVQVDDKGFVITGQTIPANLQTSVSGIFAIGDVRAGSTKRVAAAVGEGAAVVSQIHAYLAEQSPAVLASCASKIPAA